MSYEESMIEVMKQRTSVRTFDTKPLTEQDEKIIKEYINNEDNLIGPFGNKGKMEYVKVTKNVTGKGIKIGTYGFIKNPQAYLVGFCANNKYSIVEFGHTFHKLVLFLTAKEIGTCWMGGTFSRKSFEKELSIREWEIIPCVTPAGYPKENKRVFDRALRYAVKADRKKAWDQLFYEGVFGTVLSPENAGRYETPIEMVRIGPSASNKQPWRLVLAEDRKTCHFYIEHTPNYSTSFGYDMQLLDLGIAMCQFELACREPEIDGKWVIEDPALTLPNDQTEYIVTWVGE
ncbi:nitroreductase family protein [Evansella clarkii]|uniref:nitroreductase family protein n=1 Tax=Evansella clarkii TaxID=79879 RepID=UPI000B43FAAF|nr:nitroreductase family protein [Evansella clarkii]